MPILTETLKGRKLILPYLRRVLPAAERELDNWRCLASGMPDSELARQALASITHKRFHCQGGSVFALYDQKSRGLIPFIVALQTISDYLDNLSDRVGGAEEASLAALHEAMEAAVDAGLPLADWYRHYPHRDDGCYLKRLVLTCRNAQAFIPGYNDVQPEAIRLISLYSDLQVFKHLEPAGREERLRRWYDRYADLAPEIKWWEFAAACGSTLGIFALAALAAAGPVSQEKVEELLDCYFPWLCGLHILLDYFLDLDEDRESGDLNFVSYYPSPDAMGNGLLRFLDEAARRACRLPRPSFHVMVVKGLLAMYLSDPKATLGGRKKTTQLLLRRGGLEVVAMHRFCLALRYVGKLQKVNTDGPECGQLAGKE